MFKIFIMKKATVLWMFVLIAGVLSAQPDVQSAFNYHNQGKLDKAKISIDKAILNPKAATNAKTWFYRGNIYIDICRSQDSFYKNLDPEALTKAHQAFLKATELDIKNEYKIEILQRMDLVAQSYFNEGANMYNAGMTALSKPDSIAAQKEFYNSVNSFENAFRIYENLGRTDTTTLYYISVAAELGKQFDKAKSTLTKLIEMKYPEPAMYTSLANIYYKQDKNIEKALQYFALGRSFFPENLNLLLNETNVFLAEGYTEKALSNLQLAAQIDQSNPTIFFAIGAKYNEVADDTTKSQEIREQAFSKAADAYKKSIELKPDYFDPNYNMGALYVNKAAALMEIANNLPLSEQIEYDRIKQSANDFLQNSLPFLEKANQLQPDNRDTLVSLKEIYTRLGMKDKLSEVDAKLKQ
jgi:hypothetical protein